MMPRAEVVELRMSVDEALKYVVSMGVVAPRVRQSRQNGKTAPAAEPPQNS